MNNYYLIFFILEILSSISSILQRYKTDYANLHIFFSIINTVFIIFMLTKIWRLYCKKEIVLNDFIKIGIKLNLIILIATLPFLIISKILLGYVLLEIIFYPMTINNGLIVIFLSAYLTRHNN